MVSCFQICVIFFLFFFLLPATVQTWYWVIWNSEMTTGLTALSYDCWAQAPPANLKTIMWWKMNERMHSIHAGLILFISASIKHPVCYLWTRSTFRQKVESWTGRSLVKLQESISFIIGFLIHFQNLETDICGTKTGSIFPTLCINKREFHSLVLQTCLRSLKPHCIYSWQNSHVLEKGCADGPTLTKAKSHTHTHCWVDRTEKCSQETDIFLRPEKHRC